MSRYFTIAAASRLTGKPEHEIREELIALIADAKRASSELYRIDEFGEWLVHRDLIQRWKPAARETSGSDMQSEMFALLKSQMEAKDSQIFKLQEQMQAMIERIREMNVMLHEFQQQLALQAPHSVTPAGETAGTIADKEVQVETHAENEAKAEEKREAAPASFSEWLKKYQ